MRERNACRIALGRLVGFLRLNGGAFIGVFQHIHLRPLFKHRIQHQIVHGDDRHFFMLVKRLEQARQMFGKRRYLRRRHEIPPDIRIAGNGKCEQQIVAQPVDV